MIPGTVTQKYNSTWSFEFQIGKKKMENLLPEPREMDFN